MRKCSLERDGKNGKEKATARDLNEALTAPWTSSTRSSFQSIVNSHRFGSVEAAQRPNQPAAR